MREQDLEQPSRLALGRRALGRLVLAGGAVMIMPAWAQATAIPPAGVIPFSVFRPQGRLGHHRVRFRQDGNRQTVDVDIQLQVSLGPVTLFRYTHRNREVWEGDRLVSIDTRTNDDGEEFRVTGRAAGDGFQVSGSGGSFTAPADIMPSSYWHADTVNRDVLLHTQRGELYPIETRTVGTETIEAGGRSIQAQRYRMTGTLQVDAWYSEAGQWVKLAFTVRDTDVEYVLDPGSGGAPTVITG
jgi:hypothetical protein